jgi:hypothetical protein
MGNALNTDAPTVLIVPLRGVAPVECIQQVFSAWCLLMWRPHVLLHHGGCGVCAQVFSAALHAGGKLGLRGLVSW